MARYICLSIHTERLHNEKIWHAVKKFLRFLNRKNIKASWFVLNPVFVSVGLSGDDEEKWFSRLKLLAAQRQIIAQHSHFYQSENSRRKGKKYDLTRENVLARIRQDRDWLGKQGFRAQGFLSGAWHINNEILQVLAEQGFQYDMSLNAVNLENNVGVEEINGILEIPATCTIKTLFLDLISFRLKRRFIDYKGKTFATLNFHDFDLAKFSNRFLLKTLLLILPIFGIKFIDIEKLLCV